MPTIASKDRTPSTQAQEAGGGTGQGREQDGSAAASPAHTPVEGRARAVIDAVRPAVDGGAYPVKRVVGELVDVEADVFADGHDKLGVVLQWRQSGDQARQREGEEESEQDVWHETRMTAGVNDAWAARFTPTALGDCEFRVIAWADPFLTWSHDLGRRIEAGQELRADLEIGAAIVREAAAAASDQSSAKKLEAWAERLRDHGEAESVRGRAALSDELAELMWSASPRRFAATSDAMPVWVDRPLALFGAWYEMFPRSAAFEPGAHGTLRDVRARLNYVESMGFDVLYLPPIHPIGRRARKGKNNAERADVGDVGSPWAIGGPEGGHDAIHPDLGTFDDFDALVKDAASRGIEIAMDIAFQCSPDHPYVREHPEWFRHRPDGSIQYAENPPKKYQDIYPFDFECDAWRELWAELKRVFEFWIERGVSVFRVDNPHTKPFAFWEWVIAEIRRDRPDVLFLSEAFTRPKKMKRLAKLGFSQSYTYFAWRNGPEDLRRYMEELSSPPECDLMRPNFWPNTPDILTDYLAEGGRDAAMARLVLAATLTPAYGIYGPVFELCDFRQRPGSEENLDNEKYEIRRWDRDDRWSLAGFIGLMNRIRRERPALQQYRDVTFHHCDNPAHVAYSKRAHVRGENGPGDTGASDDVVLCVVNTNHSEEHWGLVRLDLAALGVRPDEEFVAHDLLTGVRRRWRGADQTIGLGPGRAHVLHIERAARTERDFDAFV